jgi:hypothetical protein
MTAGVHGVRAKRKRYSVDNNIGVNAPPMITMTFIVSTPTDHGPLIQDHCYGSEPKRKRGFAGVISLTRVPVTISNRLDALLEPPPKHTETFGDKKAHPNIRVCGRLNRDS